MYLEEYQRHAAPDPLAQARANRGRLVQLLLDRTDPGRPVGFMWAYENCITCAMGLAMRAGLLGERVRVMAEEYARVIGQEPVGVLAQRELSTIWAPALSSEETLDMAGIAEERTLEHAFGLARADVRRIFGRANDEIGACDAYSVKPEHVAALLEAAPYYIQATA